MNGAHRRCPCQPERRRPVHVIRAMSLANPLWGAPRMENSSSSASMLVKPRSPNAWQGTGDRYLKTGRRSSGTMPMGLHRLTVEQDHRSIKLRLGPMLGLKHFQRASITIAGHCKKSVPEPAATISPTQRDLHVLAVDEHGRMNWQKASSHNTRSKVEAAISRYKRVIGDTLKSRHDTRRATDCNCHQVPQPHEPTRACAIHSNSMIEAASTSRHASQSLHATRSPQADA